MGVWSAETKYLLGDHPQLGIEVLDDTLWYRILFSV